ncbi:MAG: ATP-binding protein [Candidatus Sericytochromatia bacterium]|nr:ATP-binding protein [Candidatus Sericytochromatia bacterium]
MAKESSVNEVDLVIPMLPDIEVAATKTAAAVAEYMKFDSDKIDELNQALIEACINSFEHSKSLDKKLYIKFIINDNELTVVIKDKGSGFDTGSINENPDIKDKLKSDYKRGWGLMLMKNLMDSVEIDSNEYGTTLTMTKIK